MPPLKTCRVPGTKRHVLRIVAAAAFVSALPAVMTAAKAAEAAGPLVIAHRGASSYLPEQTQACFVLAHAQGADYIEIDVASTRDGILICLHDPYLETTTDVADKFPGRSREDGHYYVVDFTLAEVKTLQAFGRAKHEDRKRRPGYQIPTLEETILLNQHLNTTTKRDCGLLVETKNPGFYRKEGYPLEAPLLEMLSRYGYTEPGKGIILQSFDAAHLRRLRLEYKTRLPLMLLVDTLPTAENLPEIAAWANGINPSRYAVEKDSTLTTQATVFLRLAKEKNLRVFVWTFNAEEAHMRRFLSEFRVDGVITNNPDIGKRATEEADRK